MDTVRSEYSEGSLASSRLDDGSGTGRASLSFSFSNSHTSRLSVDSASTRSDYLSSYERKFRERKAAKHKRSEKAKREKEKADRRELFSADQRHKAEREAERLSRRREMETWLADPNELRRIERRSQKRSRDRMRTLKEWYVPATSGPAEEVQPVFVAALTQQQSNQEHPTRKKLAKPLLSKESAAIKDEEDREVLEGVLQRQFTAFTTKLEYLEQLADTPTIIQTRAKTRAGLPRRRRRVARENMLLAPLGPARSNMQAAKSAANLPSYYAAKFDAEARLTTSTSLQTLRTKSRLPGNTEDTEDALDDAEVDEYLLCHRKVAKQSYAAVKLQATWRMHLRRRKYLPWRLRRTRHRRAVFEIWVMTYRVGNRAQRSLLRKYFSAWHTDVIEALQLREMELHLFRQAATQAELPRMVLNLVFTSDWEDERAKRMAAKAAEAAKKKEIAPSSKAAFLHAFLNAAFGELESASDKGRSRVHQLRAQHAAAREEVRKKVVQHVFRLWKRVHESKKRVGLNAQLCLKRAVRMAFGTRQRWPAEILLAVFDIWARWATFNRCKRLGLPLPRFAEPNPQWDIWLHNYQERQVRSVKAAAKAPGARLRRFFLRFHAFARRTIRERQSLAMASEHYARTLKQKALLEWREAIAGSAAEKKLVRGVLMRLHRYACAKRKLRPLKEALRLRQREWYARRVWRGWKRVQLHACFKRELNLSRLENSQAWRARLHRTLDIWRNERDSLLLSRTFEAWTHCVRKRKLFLTLRSLCARQERRNLLFSVFHAWKAAKWDRVDGFLEDRLRLDAWDTYRELSVFFPMMFYGSFSDAGSIFGGLPSYLYGDSGALQRLKQDKQELLLSTSGDAVRHFHGVLVRDSVVEVRNSILQARHLVNAVDDASGNTALHVAAQIEEPERRLEILSLLLSEGAATLKRTNRHGLSPVQLAPDPDARLLLEEGIFALHSRNILKREVVAEGYEENHRLLWCMVTLMTREWGIGLRIPAEVRVGQWHSTLREELWLRQKQIRFAPNSPFAPAVRRSRGFLNALKARLCVSLNALVHDALPHKMLKNTEDSKEARECRYHEWEERSKARQARASQAGEYEAYARYLLATTLDTEACEQELIPSFVGLLFTLDFSVDEVLSHAYRLEDECTAAEGELWELYQRIQRAEKEWSALFSQELKPSDTTTRTDVGMLRLFSDDANADLFFRRELFLLEFEQFNGRDRDVRDDGMDIQQEALALEIDTLLIRMKRKLRKAEKKVKKVHDQIDERERAYRDTLFADSRRVDDISVTRRALEQARLRMAMALVKYKDVQAVVARLDYAKRVLLSDPSLPKPAFEAGPNVLDVSPPAVATLTFEERRKLLVKEKTRYSCMFQTRVLLEQAQEAARGSADPDADQTLAELPEALHPLQKEAVGKLHALFVLNLFRSCCCWLAENMVAINEAHNAESIADSESEESEDEQTLGTEDYSRMERKSVGLARLLHAAGDLFSEGASRRRSSLKNTRRVLETYHRGCTMMDLLDPDNEAMNATYSASAALLFEEERRTVEEAERERLSTKNVETIAAISERNPVTGQLELAPDHIVDIDAIPTSAGREPAPVLETNDFPRNRKKEELQRAMMHRQLQRQDSSESESEDSMDSPLNKLLPVIHGTGLHFGNFVAGDGTCTDDEVDYDHALLNKFAQLDKRSQDPADATSSEAMWKRGAVKLTDGAGPSIKEVLAHAHRLSTSRETLRPGSRRHGVFMAPELPQPQEVVQEESQPASTSDAIDPSSPLRSINLRPTNDQEKPKRRSSVVAIRPLGRAASMSCLLPARTAIITSPGTVKKTKLDINRTCDLGKKLQRVQELPELVLPIVQISMRSRQNSASPSRTSRKSTRGEGSSCDPICQVSDLDQQEMRGDEMEKIVAVNSEEPHLDGDCAESSKAAVREPLETGVTLLLLQSPVVDVITSRTLDQHGESQSESKGRQSSQIHVDNASLAPEIDVEARSVAPFIKWEAGTSLEAFPLAVVASSQPGSAVPSDRGNSMSCIGSVRMPMKLSPGEDVDELVATRFMLEDTIDALGDSDILPDDLLTLQGKSLVMSKKYKGMHWSTADTRAQDTYERKQQPKKDKKTRQTVVSVTSSPGSASTPRPTPAITVTVVTKPVKREVEVIEPLESMCETPTSELLKIEKPPLASPKPFVKLDGEPSDTDVFSKLQSRLQLEVTGLGSSVASLHPRGNVGSTKLDRETKHEQIASPSKSVAASRIPARHSRSRALPMPISPSLDDLSLQGARMMSKNDEADTIEKQVQSSSCKDLRPLTKAQKEEIWQDFSAAPLSTTMQDAYTILYPQMYSASVTTTKPMNQDIAAMPARKHVIRKNASQPSIVTEPSQLSHLSLRVDSTREPVQQALEQNRKFWSAVEGYRAIGSSPLIPLDTATIAQRKQDKAEGIFDQFFRGQRDKVGSGESRGLSLPWLDMYPKEVEQVRRQLSNAPKALFDELQRTAELQISAALAKRQTEEALG